MNRTTPPIEFPKLFKVPSLLMTALLVMGLSNVGSAQCPTHCSISCFPNVNIVLSNDNCEALILPSTVSNAITPACDSEYEVTLKDATGHIIPNNIVNRDHVGGDITFHLSNIVLGCENFCWGRLTIENKTLPAIATSTITGMCGATHLAFPSLDDVRKGLDTICTAPIGDLSESFETLGDKCTEQITIRTVRGWINIDGPKHVTVRIDTIVLTKLTNAMVTCPGSAIFDEALEVDCHLTDEYPAPDVIAKYFHDTLAYPWIDKGRIEVSRDTFEVLDSIRETIVDTKIELPGGLWAVFPVVTKTPVYKDSIVVDSAQVYIPILPAAKECNLTTKYSDQTYSGCVGDLSKILRDWTILDWCSGEITMCQQWIVIVDKTAPWINIPDDSVMVSTVPWTCKASIDIADLIEVGGGCTTPALQLHANGGILEGTLLSELSLAESPVDIYIRATNGCNYHAYDTLTIIVKDVSAPVAIANDQIQATLTGDPYETEIGVAKVYVEDIDAGSHDSGCGDIRRCLLLDAELQDPLIIDNVHLTDKDGNLIYHQHQCGDPDGYYEITEESKGVVTVIETIPYVICKPFVKLCCKDIPQTKVALIVSDDSPYSPDGYSWSDVLVEDKSLPIMVCEDITVECGYDYSPEAIGYPTVYHPICQQQEMSYVDDKDIDACGHGTVLRLWSYGKKELCSQRITFEVTQTFDPMLIKWPKHYTGQVVPSRRRECEILKDAEGAIIFDIEYDEKGVEIGKTPRKGIVEYEDLAAMGNPFECSIAGDIDAPVWCNETCGLIVSSYEDLSIDAGTSCRKIIRRWTLIDWCEWTPNGENRDDENDTSDEIFEVIDDEWLTDADCDECEKESDIADHVYLRYKEGSFDIDGYYTYDQILQIDDLTPPTITAAERDTVDIIAGAGSKNDSFEDCKNQGVVKATAEDICGPDEIPQGDALTWSIVTRDETGAVIAGPKQVLGNEAEMSSGTGTAGAIHTIEWSVADACGNKSSRKTIVVFHDTKNPTPVCIQDLSTSTMGTDGTAVIWAEDFDRGSFDNCGDLKYAFLVDAQGDPTTSMQEGTFVPSITFNCDDLTAGMGATRNLEMYVIDNYGNYDFCNVRLRIDDNVDACPDGNIEAALIAGSIYTEQGEMVQEAMVTLNGTKSMMTQVDGKYGFNNSALGGDYEIKPFRDDDILNGVTILDLYIIQRHIMGLKNLESPYQFIASDINGDQRLTSIDLVELRRVILGVRDRFPNNNSWNFVNARETFDDNSKPWPFTQSIAIQNLTVNKYQENFIGIKIGDVNGNATANSATLAKGRNIKKLHLQIADQQVIAGETFDVILSSRDAIDLSALQWTIEHYGAELIEINGEGLPIKASDYITVSEDVSTIAWADEQDARRLESQDLLYTMTFKARQDLRLSESLSINSTQTPAIAYDMDLESMDIELHFETTGTFELEQNHPNPFNMMTEIGFTLARAGKASLSVFDATGRVLFVVEDDYPAGRNKIVINKDQLPSTGAIVYYQLESNDNIATRKMIFMQ